MEMEQKSIIVARILKFNEKEDREKERIYPTKGKKKKKQKAKGSEVPKCITHVDLISRSQTMRIKVLCLK